MTQALGYIFWFLWGAFLGSFLNCWVYRTEIKKSPLKGRSFCPHCGVTLKTLDLIPILSFLFLKGRCRYCHKKISFQYPLVEIATGGLFLLGSVFLKERESLLEFFLLTPFFVLIFVYDLKHYLIPDQFIYPPIFLSLIFRAIGGWGEFKEALFWAVIIGGAFALVWFLSRETFLGFGDVEIGVFMGLFLKKEAALGLFLAFLIGGIIGIILILFKHKTLKTPVPFAPFLITATIITYILGEKIFEIYLKLFL